MVNRSAGFVLACLFEKVMKERGTLSLNQEACAEVDQGLHWSGGVMREMGGSMRPDTVGALFEGIDVEHPAKHL